MTPWPRPYTKWSVMKASRMPPAEAAAMLVEAKQQLAAALPPGWYAGSPSFDGRYGQWSVYMYDPVGTFHVDLPASEWTAVGRSEVEAVVEARKCIEKIKVGRVPR